MNLPKMPHQDDIKKLTQESFGGYTHTSSAGYDELWDMENLKSDDMPLLSPRRPRYKIRDLNFPCAFYAHNALYFVSSKWFYKYNDVSLSAKNPYDPLSETDRKQLVAIGDYIIIFPDKAYYKVSDDSFGWLESSATGRVLFSDGLYAGEQALSNALTIVSGDTFKFKAGDAVEISGCTGDLEINNQTLIIREISDDGQSLYFYENSFFRDNSNTGDYAQYAENITVARKVPDMDFLCECENRLWGCKGNDIFASKLGDPFNFYAYDDGISTGSYWVQTGSAGDFTGCCSFLGYPVFFKEDQIYKVHGSRPSNFQVMGSASLGIAKGSHQSPAIAGEKLFYLSRAGIVSYSGGVPSIISQPFGNEKYYDAVGGSDGVKYYVSMKNSAGEYSLFVYDTLRSVWHKENCGEVFGFGFDDGLYMLENGPSRGSIWYIGGGKHDKYLSAQAESPVSSMARFGRCYGPASGRNGVTRFHIKTELEQDAQLSVKISYDGAPFEEILNIQAQKRRGYHIPIIPKRCEYFDLSLEGKGEWKLINITREIYGASSLPDF